MKIWFGSLLILLVVAGCSSSHGGTQAEARVVMNGPDVFECNRVAAVIHNCNPYLRGNPDILHPSASCCNEAGWLSKMVYEQEDNRPSRCKCFNEAVSYLQNIKNTALLDLSNECHVDFLNGDHDCKNML